jgi:hypothetical protein
MRTGSNERANGTFDGQPAVIKHNPDKKMTDIYWGGAGRLRAGIGHNHATVRDANPDAFHFMRVRGRVVVNSGFKPHNPGSVRAMRENEAAANIAGILRKALRDAICWNTMGFRK